MEKAVNFLKRHFTALLMFGATFGLVGASRQVNLQTALTLVTFEVTALWLLYMFLFVFSPVNFVQIIVNRFEGKEHEKDAYIATVIVCTAIVAVHVLVAGCVFGIYFTQYSPTP